MSRRGLYLAILLRLLVIPFFFHPDIKSQLYHCQFLGQGIVNIYQFVADNKSHLPYPNIFVYLPFTYFFFGLINIILSPLYPNDLFTWLNDWSFYQHAYSNLLYFLLILKIPYLIADFVIAFLIHRLSKGRFTQYWLFNPLVLYLIYIQGNFDIIPVMFTLLSFYLLQNKKNFLGFTSLGLAIALKLYPLLLLPFLIIKYSSKISRFFVNTLICLLPLIISIAPFLNTPSFLDSFLGSGLTQKIIEAKIYQIPIYPVIYLLVLIEFYFRRNIPKSFLYLFLSFLTLVRFHPQWLLWFLPFIIEYFAHPKIKYLFITTLVFALFYIFLINDNFLFWGHLTPLDWQMNRLPPPAQFLKLRFSLNPLLIQQYLKYLIGLLSLSIIFQHEKSRPHHS